MMFDDHLKASEMRLIAPFFLALAVVFVSMLPASAASEMRASLPDYDVTSLSEADMDLYLSVMRETVGWFENPDQGLLDLFAENERTREAALRNFVQFGNLIVTDPAHAYREGWRPIRPVHLFQFHDEVIAARRGARDRYVAISKAIDLRLGVLSDRSFVPPACGRGGNCGPNPTPLQRVLMQREKAARDGDASLIASNRAEIEDLRRRFTQAIRDR